MNIVIIEDEIPTGEILSDMLLELDNTIQINAQLRSVTEVKHYFAKNIHTPNLIFLDMQLQNENSLDLLSDYTLPAPIIYVTAYDQYAEQAFKESSIDFIPKPIKIERLSAALKKYQTLQTHFTKNITTLLETIQNQNRIYRHRLLLKKGREFFFIDVKDIAYVYTDRSIVIIADFKNQKYVSDYKILSTLEDELNPDIFFRANRKYLINIKVISKFRIVDRVKLSIDFVISMSEEIIVSQENSASFKDWVGNRKFNPLVTN